MKKINCAVLQAGIILVVLIILLLSIFWLPSVAEFYAEDAPEYAYLKWPLLIGIYLTVIPFLLGAFEGIRLLVFIQRQQAFDEETVLSLKKIKIYALIVMGLYLVGGLTLYNLIDTGPAIALLGILITLASLMISLFAGILQELVVNALQFKMENDLTV